jgi:uncharacterized protein DUF2059/type II secretion system (T2SS) protein G
MRKSLVVLLVTAMAVTLIAADIPPAKQALIRELLQTTRASDRASDVNLYDRYLTEKQLRELVAFFKSETGQRYLAVSRELSQQSRQQIAADLQIALEKSKAARTRADMRMVAVATEAYATDNNKYPNARDLAGLEKLLAPTYIRTFPRQDAWGHVYVYVVSPDIAHYIIASAGPDGKLEAASTVFRPAKDPRAYGDDLVFTDGEFVRGGDNQRSP